MARQQDYGSGDATTLVPASLRVFRHFAIDSRTGALAPMNYSPENGALLRYNGAAENQKPYPRPRIHPETLAEMPYEASCIHYNDPTRYGYVSTQSGAQAVLAGEEHQTPSVDCTCGFYAHYSPDTDFYPSHFWGPYWAREFMESEAWATLIIVRAVIEVSGTVVMGRLGCRAQKMRVVAIAPDWKKFQEEPPAVFQWGLDYYDPLAADDFAEKARGKASARAEAGRAVEAVARRYGVRHVYVDAEDMYADYPKEDIEALGVDTTPLPEPEEKAASAYSFLLKYTSTMNPPATPAPQWATQNPSRKTSQRPRRGGSMPQYVIYDEVKKTIAKHFSDATITINAYFEGSTPVTEEIALDAVETVKERALRLKKDRPAPPGVGIDRRKRKL